MKCSSFIKSLIAALTLGNAVGALSIGAQAERDMASSIEPYLQDVVTLEQTWNDVYLAQDAEAFARLLHDDFAYSGERGVYRN